MYARLEFKKGFIFIYWSKLGKFQLLKVFMGTCSSGLGTVSATTGFESVDDVIDTVAITMLAAFSLIVTVA